MDSIALKVLAVLALMPELGSLTNKGVAALAGLAPQDRQSGKWDGRSFMQPGAGLSNLENEDLMRKI